MSSYTKIVRYFISMNAATLNDTQMAQHLTVLLNKIVTPSAVAQQRARLGIKKPPGKPKANG